MATDEMGKEGYWDRFSQSFSKRFNENNKEFQEAMNRLSKEAVERNNTVKKVRDFYKLNGQDEKLKEVYELAFGQSGLDKKLAEKGISGKIVGGLTDNLSEDLAELLTDFGNFGKNFKKLGKGMLNDMLKIGTQTLVESVVNKENMNVAYDATKAVSERAGKFLWNFVKSLFPTRSKEPTPSGNTPSGDMGQEEFRQDVVDKVAAIFKKDGALGGIFDKLTSKFKEGGIFGGVLDKVAGVFKGGGFLGGIFDKVASVFKGGGFLNGIFDKVASVFKGGGFLNGIFDKVAGVFKGGGFLGGIFDKVAGVFKGGGIFGSIFDKIASIFTGGGGIIQALGNVLKGSSAIASGNMGSFVGGGLLPEKSKSVLDSLKELISSLSGSFGELLGPDGPFGGISILVSNLTKSLFGKNGLIGGFLAKLGGVFDLNPMKTTASQNIGGGLLSNILHLLPFGRMFHSGGVVPEGANMKLPGTQEQLALLKGGERVLSPAENTSYEQGSEPFVFTVQNLNIQAWDSKDVVRCFKDNKDLLNFITYQGIKNNNQMLRHIVRNA